MVMPVTPLLRDWIVLLAAKRTMLNRQRATVRTLVLGSSHADCGFDPRHCPDSFNLACRSQDLKHSCLLYEKIASTCAALQNVVIFYSVFSASNIMERVPGEKHICPAINEIFDLGLEYPDDEVRQLSAQIRGRLNALEVERPGFSGFLPDDCTPRMPTTESVADQARVHVDFSRREEGHLYLMRLLLLARQRKHRVVLVVSPARSDYVRAVGPEARRIVRHLSALLFRDPHGCDVQLINAFDSGEFEDVHFSDSNHLDVRTEGPRLLTSRIRQAVAS